MPISKRIRSILIANRGEIASRIIRTCREMGIRPIAIYADPDRDAPFVREADEAIYIGPPMASASFLAIDKMVEMARRAGADAVHPGYGFLAENADFAEACAAAAITFIGPSPHAIRQIGNKSRAKEIARAVDVPVIPGFTAAGLSDAELRAQAQSIGYPILLKAAAGGGGKGMRIVSDAGDLPSSRAAAQREAKAAFGDDALLVERYIESPRHVEIQIVGDQHGNLVHCFERECSIQRRYQKIIEEAPSPVVDEDLRQRMTAAALRLAARIDYTNAGTVEFVVDPHRNFYFLEVNTRLQVEHPVTEAITGLDLVRLQIEIAEGAPLPFDQQSLQIRGHAMEARLCAESPEREFLPSTGKIVSWEPPRGAGIRCDAGVRSGSEISIHYDSLIAKIIAHGADREAAARRLSSALRRTRIHGLRTNRNFLVRVLESEAFLQAELDTHFLARHADLREAAPTQLESDINHALAAALWQQVQRRAQSSILASVASGWRNNFSEMQHTTFRSGEQDIRIDYAMHGNSAATVVAGGVTRQVKIVRADERGIAVECDAIQRRYEIATAGERLFVYSSLGDSDFEELPRFPESDSDSVVGGCQAPMPGKILALRVTLGDSVTKGQTMAVLEAMKMEHDVIAPYDGAVAEIRIEVGQQVNTGDVLLVIEEHSAEN